MNINEMVNRFLSWPLPKSVCADPCASNPDYPHRSGTNLLNALEARQMLEHVLGPAQRTPLLFSRRKAIADKLGVSMDETFNAIVREVEEAHNIKIDMIPLRVVGEAS